MLIPSNTDSDIVIQVQTVYLGNVSGKHGLEDGEVREGKEKVSKGCFIKTLGGTGDSG